jgi:hypothetical protein
MVANTVIAKENAISNNYLTVTPGKQIQCCILLIKYKKYIKGI